MGTFLAALSHLTGPFANVEDGSKPVLAGARCYLVDLPGVSE